MTTSFARFVTGLCIVAATGHAESYAFDTGSHADVTREALADAGMNNTAIRIVQLENWLADYYSSQPIAFLEKDLAKLHFDNLLTPESVSNYWGRLTANTKKAVEDAARSNNSMQVLALLGMSLHAVQDFYTHSNWVESHPAQGTSYNTVTWFDDDHLVRVYTGRYPADPPYTQADHGGYDGGLNHDSYSRPDWDRAYVFAYVASRQWTNQIRLWVSAINPSVWNNARNISLSQRDGELLTYDLEASYRISEWIALKGADGHWKGKGSGSNAEFVNFAFNWTRAMDSPFVKHFKEEKWHQLLCGGMGTAEDLATDAPPSGGEPQVAHLPITKRAVIVRTTYLEEDSVGTFERKIDSPGGKADFYAKITVDGQQFIESMQRDRSQLSPAWMTIKFVDDNRATVPIQYELWDEDGGIAGDDDHCDISPHNGYDLNLQYDLNNHRLSGTIEGVFDNDRQTWFGKGNEKDRAKIRLYVTTRSLMNPAPAS